MMFNLSNCDRSRIRWERYRGYIIWVTEWPEEDGSANWTGCYGVILDGDWIADPDRGWMHNVIDQWCDEK